MSLLAINDLRVSVEGKEILHGVSLVIEEGELHAIMGPNGSGKSTLVQTLMGHPKYAVTSGTVMFQGNDLLAMKPDERARAGLFLAFQYPKEIAGVSLRSFLFAAYSAQMGARGAAAYSAQMQARDPQWKKLSPLQFRNILEEALRSLRMDPALAERSVNQGFSGGEKKKAEILQLSVLKPALALLDETDSGLDIDALKIVADGVNTLRKQPTFSAVLVTHYARILGYLKPDKVHVMAGGKLVESGGAELAKKLEKEGYGKYGTRDVPTSLALERE